MTKLTEDKLSELLIRFITLVDIEETLPSDRVTPDFHVCLFSAADGPLTVDGYTAGREIFFSVLPYALTNNMVDEWVVCVPLEEAEYPNEWRFFHTSTDRIEVIDTFPLAPYYSIVEFAREVFKL